MKSTCVLIIVCAMNVNFSRSNNKPAAWRVFLWVRGVFFCGCVGAWGCGDFMFFVELWGFHVFCGVVGVYRGLPVYG